jgi:hypothetical protein
MMTYSGHVKNGQILLDEPADLPEGASVKIEIAQTQACITRPKVRRDPPKFEPIKNMGPSLSVQLIKDRR